MVSPQPADSAILKTCCANLYESDWAQLLLGGSFHPGGLALTERLGTLLHLQPGHRVLDVASGKGTSAIHIAQRFGCDVVGVDYSARSVEDGIVASVNVGVSDRVRFKRGDAETLPFGDAEFDAVICECAFCTFPDKCAAASEFARVLKPSGRVGLSDLTRSGPLTSTRPICKAPDLPSNMSSYTTRRLPRRSGASAPNFSARNCWRNSSGLICPART